jgi:glycerate 2-kinase
MIVIAPTSFKGTITAAAAAQAMAAGATAVTSEPLLIQPLSDGGPGLIDALSTAATQLHHVTVRGPLGDDVTARILMRGSSAVVESADACGLQLVPEPMRDPTQLDTFGVGQLLRAAAELPVERVVVGLGGSATIDGGVGMADGMAGRPLGKPVIALADVDIMLKDAPRIFGPQKGATQTQIAILDAALAKLMEITGFRDFPGAGAAGGLAYGLHVFLNAEVVAGSEWVLDETGLRDQIKNAKAVVTGEGSYDEQSFMGKITGAVVRLAAEHNIPVLVISGQSPADDGYAKVITSGGALLTEAHLESLVRQQLPALLRS